MPYQEEAQPQKTVSELQAECEAQQLAIVSYNAWVSACRLMALREYHQNLKGLNYGGDVSGDAADCTSGHDGTRPDNEAPQAQEREGQGDAHHDRTAQTPVE